MLDPTKLVRNFFSVAGVPWRVLNDAQICILLGLKLLETEQMWLQAIDAYVSMCRITDLMRMSLFRMLSRVCLPMLSGECYVLVERCTSLSYHVCYSDYCGHRARDRPWLWKFSFNNTDGRGSFVWIHGLFFFCITIFSPMSFDREISQAKFCNSNKLQLIFLSLKNLAYPQRTIQFRHQNMTK